MIRSATLRVYLHGGANVAALYHTRRSWARGLASGLSSKPAIIRRELLRKMKRGVERLPSQGPDPAISDATPNGWRIAVAPVLERYPVVVPEPHPFEAKYLEGRFKWQQSIARPMPEEAFKDEASEMGGKLSSSEEALAQMYKPAPIITEADKSNDIRSEERALRERLYFLVKRSATSSHYQFPQSLVTSPNTTMRAYAELALQSTFKHPCPITVHFFSNAPSSHLAHVYGHSTQQKSGYYGVKVFFYRAVLLSGSVSSTKTCSELLSSAVDYAWARDSELPDMLSAETYEAVTPLLFGVEHKVDLSPEYIEGDDEALWV